MIFFTGKKVGRERRIEIDRKHRKPIMQSWCFYSVFYFLPRVSFPLYSSHFHCQTPLLPLMSLLIVYLTISSDLCTSVRLDHMAGLLHMTSFIRFPSHQYNHLTVNVIYFNPSPATFLLNHDVAPPTNWSNTVQGFSGRRKYWTEWRHLIHRWFRYSAVSLLNTGFSVTYSDKLLKKKKISCHSNMWYS